MGSEENKSKAKVTCMIQLLRKPEWSCDLLIDPPSYGADASGFTWQKIKNHKVMQLEADEGLWTVESGALWLGGFTRFYPKGLYIMALDGVPEHFHHYASANSMFTGQGSMRSGVELLYTIKRL